MTRYNHRKIAASKGNPVSQPSKETRERNELRKLPMMPIRDMVIFPYMMTPFVVGRESSVRALEEALTGDRKIFLATQHDARIDEPRPEDIYQVGTIGNIVQSVKMPDGNIKVLVEGLERAQAVEMNDSDGFFVATVRVAKPQLEVTPQIEQLMQRVTSLFEQYVKLQQSLNYETMIAPSAWMSRPSSPTPSPPICSSMREKQELLDIFDPSERLARVADVLDIEIEKLNMDRSVQTRVKRQMERAQKEYYLNEKIKAIQKELGRGEKSEFDELTQEDRNRRHAQGRLRKGDPGAEEAGSHAAHVGRVDRLPKLPRLAAGCAVEEEIARKRAASITPRRC